MAESDYGENINNKADFKVGVHDVFFSVYTQQNCLLVLLVMRQKKHLLNTRVYQVN